MKFTVEISKAGLGLLAWLATLAAFVLLLTGCAATAQDNPADWQSEHTVSAPRFMPWSPLPAERTIKYTTPQLDYTR